MEEIIDLFVDFSNTFGSAIRSIMMRFKKYSTIIKTNPPKDSVFVNDFLSYYPNIKEEMDKSPRKIHTVLVDNAKVNSGKATITVVFLDDNNKYLHSFSFLTGSLHNSLLSSPFYWNV